MQQILGKSLQTLKIDIRPLTSEPAKEKMIRELFTPNVSDARLQLKEQ